MKTEINRSTTNAFFIIIVLARGAVKVSSFCVCVSIEEGFGVLECQMQIEMLGVSWL